MKVGLDENIGEAIYKALLPLVDPATTDLVHLPGFVGRGAKDIPLISAFRAADGEVLVSGDRNLAKRKTEVAAIRTTGLKLVVLPPSWNNLKLHAKAGFLIAGVEAPLGSALEVEMHWSVFRWRKIGRR